MKKTRADQTSDTPKRAGPTEEQLRTYRTAKLRRGGADTWRLARDFAGVVLEPRQNALEVLALELAPKLVDAIYGAGSSATLSALPDGFAVRDNKLRLSDGSWFCTHKGATFLRPAAGADKPLTDASVLADLYAYRSVQEAYDEAFRDLTRDVSIALDKCRDLAQAVQAVPQLYEVLGPERLLSIVPPTRTNSTDVKSSRDAVAAAMAAAGILPPVELPPEGASSED